VRRVHTACTRASKRSLAESAFGKLEWKAEHLLTIALILCIVFTGERVCGALRAQTAALRSATGAPPGAPGGRLSAPPTPESARKKER